MEKVLILLVIVSLVLVLLPKESKLTFANHTSNIFLYPVMFITGRLIELKLLNRDLSEVNDQLNKALIELNKLRFSKETTVQPSPNLIIGLITGRDRSTMVRLLTLDRGSDHGIREGLPVVFEGKLIGKVVEMSKEQSIVETILNPGFRVSILHLPSRSHGVMETSKNSIKIKYFSRNIDIEPGDTVITSGVSSFAPAGLLIGTIDEIKRGDELFFQNLTLLPFENIGALSHVYILGED